MYPDMSVCGTKLIVLPLSLSLSQSDSVCIVSVHDLSVHD